MVNRVYVEKKPEYAVEAHALFDELKGLLGVEALRGVRVLNRYDVEGLSTALFESSRDTVFSEPALDIVHDELPAADHLFAVEYLPGQFDQRADSASECIQLISQGERPAVRSARVYLLEGALSADDLAAVKMYLINPVEAREADLALPETLHAVYSEPADIATVEGFTAMDDAGLAQLREQYGLAMDEADLAFCRTYFAAEERDPTLTELRMIDTYWSDHCRHTTFNTYLDNIVVEDENANKSYELYKNLRKELGRDRGDKPVSLMDLGTIGAKALKADGVLKGLDESDEINACSVEINVDNNGETEPWLLLFKNETHNHPTEIEPFGGAATCIGGAIRDPLANRGYVFGAMRVTGAGDPLAPVGSTLPGKLPQRKLVTTAAHGYSSYGNQVGLATGQVTELYHPGYIAKRMEVGAVLGAVPLENVRREEPRAGDVVLLVGGRTGRDGCGGATGSSKAHGAQSLEECGAEVQKGNPPVERKLQRLFRNPEASLLIRRCNDFGAGGVSVAIGELADGLDIDLDAVPKKYDGLDGTELAISESQERMAVVVESKDAARFIALAAQENVEATQVAVVTDTDRLVMRWRGKVIVDIARSFLASSGAEKHAGVRVPPLPVPTTAQPAGKTLGEKLENHMKTLNHCCNKGLGERFDSTIGSGSVLMPYGGKYQLTPAQAMAMKIPVRGDTSTCAGMAFGFDPFISEQNPHDGAYLAVVDSVAKLCAGGFARENIYLSFQEYFERLRDEDTRWGKPFASLLGALRAQLDLGVAAIGGKDSMSGSFEELDVPPTLISFAVAAGDAADVMSPEFELPGSKLVWLRPAYQDGGLLPHPESFAENLKLLREAIRGKKVLAAWAVGAGGPAEGLCKMAFGNRMGVRLTAAMPEDELFIPAFGSFLLELAEDVDLGEDLGETTMRYELAVGGERVALGGVQEAYEARLEPVLPYRTPSPEEKVEVFTFKMDDEARRSPRVSVAKPRALIPVFPGTNCEYDTAHALHRAGAVPDVLVIRNQTPLDVAQSAKELVRRLDTCQMVVLPGGFSGGDEPDGSAKLITAFFRGPAVAEAMSRLLEMRDGLVLGICNGFQALVKLGLLPHGQIRPQNAHSPTLTFNAIGRHQSMMVRTRVASALSPWLMHEEVGVIHTIPVSHGEGRFAADADVATALALNGQIATQYVDLAGEPTMDVRFNPNGSVFAIESISSPDGRILGKMGHSERSGRLLHVNVPGNKYQRLFEGGVSYFKV